MYEFWTTCDCKVRAAHHVGHDASLLDALTDTPDLHVSFVATGPSAIKAGAPAKLNLPEPSLVSYIVLEDRAQTLRRQAL